MMLLKRILNLVRWRRYLKIKLIVKLKNQKIIRSHQLYLAIIQFLRIGIHLKAKIPLRNPFLTLNRRKTFHQLLESSKAISTTIPPTQLPMSALILRISIILTMINFRNNGWSILSNNRKKFYSSPKSRNTMPC